MQRVSFVPVVLLACGLAAAADRPVETTPVSYLKAEFQGEYAAPSMRPATFTSAGGWMSEGTAGVGLGGPHCEAGYWHDLYPTHCHKAHTIGLWDDYCTSSWHGLGGLGHGCGGGCDDCSAAAQDHEHVDVAPAVIDPADVSPESDEAPKPEDESAESESDELEAPREEPEVQVPPTQTIEEEATAEEVTEEEASNEEVSFPPAAESADDHAADDSDEAPRPDFVPVQRDDQAFPDLEVFDGLDD